MRCLCCKWAGISIKCWVFLSESKSDWEWSLYPWWSHEPGVLCLEVLGLLLVLLPIQMVLGSLSEDEFRDLFGGGEPQEHHSLWLWMVRTGLNVSTSHSTPPIFWWQTASLSFLPSLHAPDLLPRSGVSHGRQILEDF